MDSLGEGDGRREESWHSDVAAGPAWALDRWVWSGVESSIDLPQTLDIRGKHKDTALLIAIIS
jgi:hypothetical protein